MLEQAAGLSSRALQAIAELERLVVEADGGRLKLEWGQLRARSGDRIDDLLWWEGDELLGFLGLYGYGDSLELAGMVAPAARRQGIASALLDAATPLCLARGHRRPLLIVPRPSLAGKHLALGRGGELDHSEHALLLSGELSGGPRNRELSLRSATTSDIPFISRLIEVGFGHAVPDMARELESTRGRTLVVELSGEPIGTLRFSKDADQAGIYGFVIEPSRQGQGFGREALTRACEQLRTEGVRRIGLEVAVDNDRALGLYTSIGFAPVTTEDYYELPVG